jgi:hypothetical protein
VPPNERVVVTAVYIVSRGSPTAHFPVSHPHRLCSVYVRAVEIEKKKYTRSRHAPHALLTRGSRGRNWLRQQISMMQLQNGRRFGITSCGEAM